MESSLRLSFFATSVFLSLVLNPACSGGGGSGHPHPSVIAAEPLPGVAEVAISSSSVLISATFDQEMDLKTINSSTFLLHGPSGPVAGMVSYGGKRAFFFPNENLAKIQDYTARITTGAKNSQGVALEADYVWHFTTEDRKWLTDQTIDSSLNPASEANVVFFSGGKAQALWAQAFPTPVEAVTRAYHPETQSWGSTLDFDNFTSSPVSHPRIASDGKNQGHIVWSQPLGLQGAVYTVFVSGNAYIPFKRIDNATGLILDGPEVASGHDGFAFVAWIQQGADPSDHNVSANWYDPNASSWTGAQVLDTLPLPAQHVRVASNGHGTAIVAWVQNGDLYTNRFDLAGGGWLGSMLMEADVSPASSPEVAMDQSGSAFLLWSQDQGQGRRVLVRRFQPGKNWDAVQPIDAGGPGNPGFDAQIVCGPAGAAFALWTEEVPGTRELYTCRFAPSTGWAPAVLLDAPATAQGVYGTALAVSPAGNALAFWSPFDDSLFSDVLSFRYVVGKGWGSAVPAENDSASARIGACSFDANENAMVIFLSGSVAPNVGVNRFE